MIKVSYKGLKIRQIGLRFARRELRWQRD